MDDSFDEYVYDSYGGSFTNEENELDAEGKYEPGMESQMIDKEANEVMEIEYGNDIIKNGNMFQKQFKLSKEDLKLIKIDEALSDLEVIAMLNLYQNTMTIDSTFENYLLSTGEDKAKILKRLGGIYSYIKNLILLSYEAVGTSENPLSYLSQHVQLLLFFLEFSRIINDNISFNESDNNLRLALENEREMSLEIFRILVDEKLADQTHRNIGLILKQLLCFLAFPPINLFYTETKMAFVLKEKVIESLYLNPTPILYELYTFCILGHPVCNLKKFSENIKELLVSLESKLECLKGDYFENKTKSISENETHIIALLRLLNWLAKNNFVSEKFTWQEIDRYLYNFLKWFYTLNDTSKHTKMSPDLHMNMVCLIRNIFSLLGNSFDRKFIEILYYDILGCIDKKFISFITSVIAPLLTFDCQANIPLVLHPLIPISNLEVFFEKSKIYMTSLLSPYEGTQGFDKSNIFDMQTLSAFKDHLQFYLMSKQFNQRHIKWNNILDSKNSHVLQQYSALSNLLNNRAKTLFLFKGTSSVYSITIGFFVEEALCHSSAIEAKKNILNMSGDSMIAFSSEYSFIFVAINNDIYFLKDSSPNSKFIQIAQNGITFFYQNEMALYLNFGNLLLSSVKLSVNNTIKPKKDIRLKELNSIISHTNIQHFEVWSLQTEEKENYVLTADPHRNLLSNICSSFYSNYTSDHSILIPESLTVKELLEGLQNENCIIDSNIPIYIETLEGKVLITDRDQTLGSLAKIGYSEALNLFIDKEFFSDYDKIEKIAKSDLFFEKKLTVLPAIEYLDSSQAWTKLIKKLDEGLKMEESLKKNNSEAMSPLSIYFYDLNSLLQFPGLTTYLFKNREFLSLILNLIFSQKYSNLMSSNEGLYLYHKVLLITYESLRLLFENNLSPQIRTLFFQKRFLQTCLTKLIFYYNGDERRVGNFKATGKGSKENMVIFADSPAPKGIGYLQEKAEIVYDQELEKDKIFKIEDKYSTKKICAAIFGTIKMIIDSYNFNLSTEDVDILEKSELIELILKYMQSVNITELTNDHPEIYFYLLDLIENISDYEQLLHLTLKDYLHSSILNMLKILKNQSNFIFLNTKKNEKKDTVEKFYSRSKQIFEQTKQTLLKFGFLDIVEGESAQASSAKILTQDISDLDQFYPTLMKPLQIQQTSILISGSFRARHHYSNDFIGELKTEVLNRLSQEITDLSNSLPTDSTNAIFVRYDSNRLDCMRALIMGAKDTPYSSGAFVFDIAFPSDYPNQPPRVNLETTGNGSVRFNPNLYHCGKVCLSLLGTWRGSASENWNPSISTLLQVLLSIQAIIMSEWVYFNEPGHEHEMATPKGKLLNTAYSNIVKISNIRHAMIGQMKNPFPGFEQVILSHFYLKKDLILSECQKWIDNAREPAEYTGLVQSHNSSICSKMLGGNFKAELINAVSELSMEFEKLKLKIGDLGKFSQFIKKEEKLIQIKKTERYFPPPKAHKANPLPNVVDLTEVDVSYEAKASNKLIDINDSSVTNRWSRYIGAMGIESVTKQANASVLLYGLGPVGAEIAKNIVLSGLRRLTLYDKQETKVQDLSGQFFLEEKDIGFKRDIRSLNKIQQLNLYVNVDVVPNTNDEGLLSLINREDMYNLRCYQVIVMTEGTLSEASAVDKYCREHGIYFIYAEVKGLFSRIINDFGDVFEVIDKDGEPISEYVIKALTVEDNCHKIHFLEGVKHELNNGDLVLLKDIEEEENLPGGISLNDAIIEVNDAGKDYILTKSLVNHKKYKRNGICRQIKQKIKVEFTSFDKLCDTYCNIELKNHNMHEIDASQENLIIHFCFACLNDFQNKNKRMPNIWNIEDYSNEFWPLFEINYKGKLLKELGKNELGNDEILIKLFCFTAQAIWPPLAAFIGGSVAQEIIKAITHKFVPIRQVFYLSNHELTLGKLLNRNLSSLAKEFAVKGDRYDYIRACVGERHMNSIFRAKIFMIGAGAIGCELMKNYAMIGCGTEGQITLTDPDVIENSNLNRQFLFREKHIRKPKSAIAAAAIIYMNPNLKGHISARLDRVHSQTENIYDEAFFQFNDIILNALDNVNARKFIDNKCVQARRPMIDSGTLGPKGHVQVVIPFKTESYGSQSDPEDEKQIPICTLKMFPEETIHCVEWARDKFGRMFTQKPQSANRLAAAIINPGGSLDSKTLKEGLLYLQKRPQSFTQCIERARMKFEKFFVHDILQLVKVYPLDHLNKDGSLFWTFPKRPPSPLKFSTKDECSVKAIQAYSCLIAYSNRIEIPSWVQDMKQFQREVEEVTSSMIIPQFSENVKKTENLMKQGNKEKESNSMELENNKTFDSDESMIEKASMLIKEKNITTLEVCNVSEFEKDEDDNHHIDFIHAFANLRARNYKLDPMDWINVKLKAGRIIPALATTTACISALQINEMCKLLNTEYKITEIKNAFLSLSIPLLVFGEPLSHSYTEISKTVRTCLWDRWEINLSQETDTAAKLLNYLNKITAGLLPRDIFHDSRPIYLYTMMNLPEKKEELEDLMNTKLKYLIDFKQRNYADITVTFVKDEKATENMKNIPPIRLINKNAY